MVRVRPADAADAARVAAFAARLFRDTYGPAADPAGGGGSRAEDVDAYVAGHLTTARLAAALTDPAVTVLVADAGHTQYAGYVQLRAPSPHPALPGHPAAAEVARLYVDRPWRGRGVANALLAEAARRAGAAGATALWLAVYQRNARAVAFYERRGFAVRGQDTFAMGAEVQQDWIMARALAPHA